VQAATVPGDESMKLTVDEFKLIQVLIKTQRFNPDPILKGLRKKFSVDVSLEEDVVRAYLDAVTE
jgi:hypothetical protein